MEYITNLNPVLQGLIATLFTWLITALGAGVVFFFKKANKLVMDLMLGFGAGVMIAASFWSLLSPAITLCEELGKNSWLSPAIGFISGALFIVLADIIFSKLSFTDVIKNNAHDKESFRRSLLLTFAVTLHNIPEGMAVGVAFGCASLGIPNCDLISAVLLAVGIGLQNFPEGVSVALPLRAEGLSTKKSFFYGQLSGFVEPIAGVLGVVAAIAIRSILPFMLSFSAGAMVAVVSSELIPEAAKQHKKLTTLGVSIGFMIMMVLDVALG